MLELVMVLLIFAMHRENIRRILSGREPKIGAMAHAEAATLMGHNGGPTMSGGGGKQTK
jgi:hypothetical protein